MLKGMHRHTQEGKALFHRLMARARVSVQNAFAGLLQQWPSICHKSLNRLGKAPVDCHIVVAVFLLNMQGILYCNQKNGDGRVRPVSVLSL